MVLDAQKYDLDDGSDEESTTSGEDFVRLYSRSYRELYAYVRALVGNQRDVDDCMQELSMLLMRKYDRSILVEDFCRWARGFARNIVRSHHRRQRRQALVFDDDLIQRIADVEVRAGEYLELRREQLEGCLARLPDADRALVAKVYGGQISAKDVAAQARTHERTIQRALRRIRLALAKCIDLHLKLVE